MISNDISIVTGFVGPLVALAFKLEEGKFGQLTYMRLYSGTLRKGEFIVNTTNGKRIKVRTRHTVAVVAAAVSAPIIDATAVSERLCAVL